MIAVIILFSIGIGLLAGGFYYHLYDDILTDFFTPYIYNTADPYYLGANLLWDMWPYVLILMGIVCFILAGIKYRSSNSMGAGN